MTQVTNSKLKIVWNFGPRIRTFGSIRGRFVILALPRPVVNLVLLLGFGIWCFGFGAYSVALASETNGTIVSGGNNGYGWSNQAGWVNFGCTNCGISITDSGITGYAWNQNYGWINMKPTNGGVSVAASGALSGYAWGSSLGWINFSGVSINSSGKFIGQASGTIIGTLTFDCTNCSVTTDYRPSSFRTTSSSGGGGGGGGGGVLGLIGSSTGGGTAPGSTGAGTSGAVTCVARGSDIDTSGSVDILDFNLLMVHWGEVVSGGTCPVGDADGDGTVGILDFNAMMIAWTP